MNQKPQSSSLVLLDKSKYIDQFVIYLDLLGIREFIEANEESRPDEIIFLYSNLANLAHTKIHNQSVDGFTFNFEELLSPHFTTSILSDSLIITLPADKIELLPFLIRIICVAQINFMMKELPLRGYITIGKCFHDKERGVVFGGGLIEAYEKERKEVVFPRVIIDARVVYRLNKLFSKTSHQSELVEKYKKFYPTVKNTVPFFNLSRFGYVQHVGKDSRDNANITVFASENLIAPRYNNLANKDGWRLKPFLKNKEAFFRELFERTGENADKKKLDKWSYLNEHFQPLFQNLGVN